MASHSGLRNSGKPVAEDGSDSLSTPAGNTTHPTSAAGRATLVRNPPLPRMRSAPDADGAQAASRPWRDRGPNWNLQEMLALIDAKRAEYLQELDSTDARDLMDPDNKKWERISKVVMQAGFSPCLRDHVMCKGKWNLVIADYRRISDFHSRSGTNAKVYWSQSSRQHAEEGLPKTYSRALFQRIHEWFGRRPQIQPPHVRDLLSPTDGNMKLPNDDSKNDMEEQQDNAAYMSTDGNDASASASDGRWQGCSKGMSPSNGPAAKTPEVNLVGLGPTQPLPVPVQGPTNPIVLSSSDAGGSSSLQRAGNTGKRKRTSTAHAALVEATKSTRDVMVAQMQAMVGATRETESNRLAVQMSLFEEKMLYQREKDRRLYEQGQLAAENARLAIMKQGELVECLSQISQVLSVGLKLSQPKEVQLGVPAAPKDKKTTTYEDAAKEDSNSMACGGEEVGPASVPLP